jgi:phosphoenolpyruvate carboxylase
MIGYSDSNKDGGIIASGWHLNHAQKKLVEIGNKHKVQIRFFHGKGGTISRGAGPVHWFLKSLPDETLQGNIRVTEQGETIERKYANKVNATHNLELLLAGTAHRAILNKIEVSVDNKIRDEIFNFMADESFEAFKGLTHHESFIKYFEQATPIDAIESSKIGSRPARRTGKRSLKDLRAIPWVFSWTQSRTQISGWYGFGTALKRLKEEKPEHYDHLQKMVKTDNYVRYILTNIDTSLAATDDNIIKLYSTLVENEKVKDDILKLLMTELELTKSTLQELIRRPRHERRKNHYFSTRFRAEALMPLHKAQVELLKEWRTSKASISKEDESKLLRNLLRSINAIANAMGTTG